MEKQKKYNRLSFFYVDENYADFLRQNYDSRIPNITSKEYTNKKFFIGIVMKINGFDYLAPVSSNIGMNELTFGIKDKDNEVISTVRPNYMFPVVKDTYKIVQFNKIKSRFYKYLLREEWQYCNKHRAEICELAKHIYDKRTMYDYSSVAERKLFQSACCNFNRLEQGAMAYRDRSSKLLSEGEKMLIEKYPVDAKRILQIKKLREDFINSQPNKIAALEQCIRANIKFAPEIYGKEISDKIIKEDLAIRKKQVATKSVNKVREQKPVQKTQEKNDPKKKKQSQNSR